MLETGSIGFATAFAAGRDLLPLALRAAAGARAICPTSRAPRWRACATGRRAAARAGLRGLLRAGLLGRVRGVRRQRHRTWRPPAQLALRAGHRRRHRGAAVRPASRGTAADPSAGARGTLSRRDSRRAGRRRLPARPRLRLRLDPLHRPGAGRDPDHERVLGQPRRPAPACSRSIRWAWACRSCWRRCSRTCCSSGCGSSRAPGGGCSGWRASFWPWWAC